jgi:hypothetical protein
MVLQGIIRNLADISSERRDEMFALMEQHYLNIHRDDFDRDLSEKQWVIQIVEPDSGRLFGFSTQTIVDFCVAGRPVKALFSGDTVIDRRHWGSPALALAWGRLAFAMMEQHGGDELVWTLISKGFRTYRFLPVYFREFFPRFDAATPERAREIIDAFGRTMFPDRYDAASGVVRAGADRCRLRPEVGGDGGERTCDPHVQFFLRVNPQHGQGDELVCVAPLSRANFTRLAERLIASPQFAAVAMP